MKKKTRRIFAGIGLAAALFAARWYWGHAWLQITVAPEITHITSPLRDDGSVDYLAALNARYGKDVTRDNNAAIPLLQAFGLQDDGQVYVHNLALALGAPELEASAPGQAFVSIVDFRLKRMPRHPYSGEEEMAWREEVSDLAKHPWKAADHAEVAAWLDANQAVLARLTAAARLPHYFIPAIPASRNDTVFAASIGPASIVRTFAEVLAARAMLRLSSDDLTGFRDDALTLLRLGFFIGRQPSIIERLVSYAVLDSGMTLFAAALESGRLTAETARDFHRDLAALPEAPSLVECFDVYQRYEALDQIDFVARFGTEGDTNSRHANSFTFGLFPIHFDRVMRDANAWADHFVQAASVTPFHAREAAVLRCAAEAEAFVATANGREKGLRLLMSLMFYDMRGTMRLRDYTQQWRNVVLAGYSAAAQPPRSLSAGDLADWARSMPPDIFIDKPLQVEPTDSPPGRRLLIGCHGPAPLPGKSLVVSGRDLSSNPRQHDFFIRVPLR